MSTEVEEEYTGLAEVDEVEEEVVLEDDEVIEEEETQDEPEEESDDEEESTDEESSDAEEDDEIEVSIGDEVVNKQDEEEKKAPRWVKDLRKTNRELQKQNKELQQKLQSQEQPQQEQQLKLEERPKLDDFDYDEDKFAEATEDWLNKKRLVDAQKEEQAKLQQQEQEAWQNKLNDYNEKKKGLKVRDFEEAEEVAIQSFSDVQQNIILEGAENPALLVYAIGKNKSKVDELSKIKDHVKFAFAVAKLEKDLKVTSRKKAPKPEGKVSGGGKASNDATLKKLEANAMKTGDMTKLLAYERKLKRNKK